MGALARRDRRVRVRARSARPRRRARPGRRRRGDRTCARTRKFAVRPWASRRRRSELPPRHRRPGRRRPARAARPGPPPLRPRRARGSPRPVRRVHRFLQPRPPSRLGGTPRRRRRAHLPRSPRPRPLPRRRARFRGGHRSRPRRPRAAHRPRTPLSRQVRQLRGRAADRRGAGPEPGPRARPPREGASREVRRFHGGARTRRAGAGDEPPLHGGSGLHGATLPGARGRGRGRGGGPASAGDEPRLPLRMDGDRGRRSPSGGRRRLRGGARPRAAAGSAACRPLRGPRAGRLPHAPVCRCGGVRAAGRGSRSPVLARQGGTRPEPAPHGRNRGGTRHPRGLLRGRPVQRLGVQYARHARGTGRVRDGGESALPFLHAPEGGRRPLHLRHGARRGSVRRPERPLRVRAADTDLGRGLRPARGFLRAHGRTRRHRRARRELRFGPRHGLPRRAPGRRVQLGLDAVARDLARVHARLHRAPRPPLAVRGTRGPGRAARARRVGIRRGPRLPRGLPGRAAALARTLQLRLRAARLPRTGAARLLHGLTPVRDDRDDARFRRRSRHARRVSRRTGDA